VRGRGREREMMRDTHAHACCTGQCVSERKEGAMVRLLISIITHIGYMYPLPLRCDGTTASPDSPDSPDR
jgi:hypothetical protein